MRDKSAMPRKPKKLDVAIATIEALTIERIALRGCLRDLLAFWDRRDESGWTAADAMRLTEIRKLANGD